MRGLVVCLVTSILGCYDDKPGVLVEVQSDVPATRFEMLLSSTHCPECTQINPPSRSGRIGTAPILGIGWKSMDVERFPVKFEQPSNIARFFLTQGSETKVKRALIVALEGSEWRQLETVVGVATLDYFEIPADSSVKFEVKLEPADALDAQTDREHVEFWRRREMGNDYTACAVVQHRQSEPEFFVPFDDPDCDDPLPVECDEFGYLAAGQPPTLDKTTRLLADPDGHCRFAGPGCNETGTTPMGDMAVAPSYCVPGHMCTQTCSLGGVDPNCFNAFTIGAPYAECYTSTNYYRSCDDLGGVTSARMELSPLLFDANGACKSIQIAKPQLPFGFGDSIAFASANSSFSFSIDQATFDPASCAVQVKWTGIMGETQVAIISIELANGTHRVVPWRLKMASTTCYSGNNWMTCQAMPGEDTNSIYSCD